MAPSRPLSFWFSLLSFIKSPHGWKRLIHLAVFVSSGFAAFLLRFEFSIPREHIRHLAVGILVWAVTKLVVFHLLRLDRGWWRFVSVIDVARIGCANLIGSVLSVPAVLVVAPPGFPRSIYILDLVL